MSIKTKKENVGEERIKVGKEYAKIMKQANLLVYGDLHDQ